MAEPTPWCFAFDPIEHDGDDLRDLPLIDRKRRLAKLDRQGQAASRHARQTNCISQKLSLRNMPGALSVRERHSRMRPPLLMKA